MPETTPESQELRLGSLVRQAYDQIRRYENLLTHADENDPSAIAALPAAKADWYRLEDEILQLRLKVSNVSPALKDELKRFDKEVDSLRHKELLMSAAQGEQLEATASKQIELMRAETKRVISLSKQEIADTIQQANPEFYHRWIREKGVTPPLSEVQASELLAAFREEWKRRSMDED